MLASRHFKNPVLMCRRIMDDSLHCALAGDGARDFAQRIGATDLIVDDPDELITEKMRTECNFRYDEYEKNIEDCLSPTRPVQASDTVCAVAMDGQGHFACATSTGITNNNMKLFSSYQPFPVSALLCLSQMQFHINQFNMSYAHFKPSPH